MQLTSFIQFIKVFFFIILPILFFGCGKGEKTFYYLVVNKTSAHSIKANFAFNGRLSKDTAMVKRFALLPDAKTSLFTRKIVISKVTNFETANDTISPFKVFEVFANDSIPTRVNLLESFNWTYQKIDAKTGSYTLVIVDEIF
jgi:hypothetical protein